MTATAQEINRVGREREREREKERERRGRNTERE